jgi:hypothetical protein
MSQKPITLTLTSQLADELVDLLHWTNDPQFRELISQIEVANADELQTPSVDPTQRPTNNRKD